MTAITYATPDHQAIFDFVVQKIWEQGGPARSGSSCLYRHPNGRKCALGWLIPDDEYRGTMEGSSLMCATGKISNNTGIEGADSEWFKVPEENIDLLINLQKAHDSCMSMSWEVASANIFRNVARHSRLEASMVNATFGTLEVQLK